MLPTVGAVRKWQGPLIQGEGDGLPIKVARATACAYGRYPDLPGGQFNEDGHGGLVPRSAVAVGWLALLPFLLGRVVVGHSIFEETLDHVVPRDGRPPLPFLLPRIGLTGGNVIKLLKQRARQTCRRSHHVPIGLLIEPPSARGRNRRRARALQAAPAFSLHSPRRFFHHHSRSAPRPRSRANLPSGNRACLFAAVPCVLIARLLRRAPVTPSYPLVGALGPTDTSTVPGSSPLNRYARDYLFPQRAPVLEPWRLSTPRPPG